MELNTILSELSKELTVVVQEVLARSRIKKESDLSKSVQWEYKNEKLFMVVNEYYEAVSKGRKPHARKIPIEAILQWIKESGIRSSIYPSGKLAFILQRSIYENGIRGKHFIEQVEKVAGELVEIQVADSLEEELANDLAAAFEVI